MHTNTFNRQVVLHSRPHGKPTAANFQLLETPVPTLASGQVLLRTLFLSLDPYMRGRMNDGPSYAPPVAVGQPMVGATVCRVEASQNAAFAVGDLVLGNSGWQDYAVSSGEGLNKLPPTLTQPSWALGVLGMPGFTAYMGLLDIGKPVAGETVVVAAASGAVGALVGQIAKLKGCRVVGVAGGEDKCRYVVDELGFDACLDRRLPGLAAKLAEACPQGIDVYFENVGGEVFDAVWPLLNVHARIPVCGLISGYNSIGLPAGPDRLGSLMGTILVKRLTVKGFIIFDDYGPRFGEFSEQMSAWVAQGKIRFREDIVDGLEKAPQAFMGLLEGENFGKLVVRVAS
jgi:NADPH-dependent curcumin reductase CurA